MKTIVSLALAGLMSISALLPALAAQEAENVSIPENSGISESVAQDESSVSSSCSTADESTEPESGSNAEDGSDSVSQPESGSMPVESDSSTSVGSKAETGSSLPASDSMTSAEMDADSEPASGSETAESDANGEASSDVMEAAADERTVPVTVSEEYALLLATNQADSMMGHAGMRRSSTCKQLVESFILADYTADNEENAYKLLWAALNQAIVSLSEEGGGIGHCVYGSGTIRLYR